MIRCTSARPTTWGSNLGPSNYTNFIVLKVEPSTGVARQKACSFMADKSSQGASDAACIVADASSLYHFAFLRRAIVYQATGLATREQRRAHLQADVHDLEFHIMTGCTGD